MTHSFPTRRSSGLDHGPPLDRGRADVGHSARDPDLHSAVPRHRRNPRVPPEFGIGAQTRADAEMECRGGDAARSEEHTSELQSLMRISYAVFCLKKKKKYTTPISHIKHEII